MKRFMKAMVIMVAIAMVCSCANGGGSDSDKAPVKVSFNVETPHADLNKTIAIEDKAGAPTLTYWYKAVHQWTGSDFTTYQGDTANIQGNVDGYVQIDDYDENDGNANIGYFAQGAWKFWAQVKSGNTVVYESAADPEITYISTANRNVTIDVTRTTRNAGTADIVISIDAPDTSGVSSMTLTYNGLAGDPIVLSKAAHATKANWSTYTYTVDDLAAGSYLFTFTSAAGAAGANPVGGAVLAFDVIAGFDKQISGTIENGSWQTTLMTINIPTLEITLVEDAGKTSVNVGDSLNYTCTATATNVTGTVNYEWYLDNALVTSNTTGEYEFTAAVGNIGFRYITCKAYIDGKIAGSEKIKVTVNP